MFLIILGSRLMVFGRKFAACRKGRLRFFDDPIGRYAVPSVVLNNLAILDYRPLSLLSPDIIPLRSPGKFSRGTGELIAWSWLITLFGAVVAAVAARRDFSRSGPPTHS